MMLWLMNMSFAGSDAATHGGIVAGRQSWMMMGAGFACFLLVVLTP